MPTSEARINANRLNAAHSTGPRTEQGKEQSRRNALKHGLTGAGVVLPEADAAEVERRSAAFARELEATGEVGLALARHAALNSVRMERAADLQTAALSERVRRAEAEFVAPEGVDAAEADRLRALEGRLAMIDPSPEANLTRKYEAAAERGFFRALKELRQMQRQAGAGSRAAEAKAIEAMVGSLLTAKKLDAEFDARYAEIEAPSPRRPTPPPQIPPKLPGADLPFTIGRRR